jgi:hypothetical protein
MINTQKNEKCLRNLPFLSTQRIVLTEFSKRISSDELVGATCSIAHIPNPTNNK